MVGPIRAVMLREVGGAGPSRSIFLRGEIPPGQREAPEFHNRGFLLYECLLLETVVWERPSALDVHTGRSFLCC